MRFSATLFASILSFLAVSAQPLKVLDARQTPADGVSSPNASDSDIRVDPIASSSNLATSLVAQCLKRYPGFTFSDGTGASTTINENCIITCAFGGDAADPQMEAAPLTDCTVVVNGYKFFGGCQDGRCAPMYQRPHHNP